MIKENVTLSPLNTNIQIATLSVYKSVFSLELKGTSFDTQQKFHLFSSPYLKLKQKSGLTLNSSHEHLFQKTLSLRLNHIFLYRTQRKLRKLVNKTEEPDYCIPFDPCALQNQSQQSLCATLYFPNARLLKTALSLRLHPRSLGFCHDSMRTRLNI